VWLRWTGGDGWDWCGVWVVGVYSVRQLTGLGVATAEVATKLLLLSAEDDKAVLMKRRTKKRTKDTVRDTSCHGSMKNP
jgi:hypothetical protein